MKNLIAYLVVFFVLSGALLGSALSHGWTGNFKNKAGSSCCNTSFIDDTEPDCWKIDSNRITLGKCGYKLDGVCIGRSWAIHPSEDKHYYICPDNKCLFAPGGLSDAGKILDETSLYSNRGYRYSNCYSCA